MWRFYKGRFYMFLDQWCYLRRFITKTRNESGGQILPIAKGVTFLIKQIGPFLLLEDVSLHSESSL